MSFRRKFFPSVMRKGSTKPLALLIISFVFIVTIVPEPVLTAPQARDVDRNSYFLLTLKNSTWFLYAAFFSSHLPAAAQRFVECYHREQFVSTCLGQAALGVEKFAVSIQCFQQSRYAAVVTQVSEPGAIS